jgi:DNA-binding beta-propeller fold protein YncE
MIHRLLAVALVLLPATAAAQLSPLAQASVSGVGMAVDTVTNRLFVPEFSPSSGTYTGVIVLDGETLQPIGRVQVPAVDSIAVHPSVGRAYVLGNWGLATTSVSVIDTTSLQVVGVIDLPFQSFVMTVDTATGLLYLRASNGPGGSRAIAVIDPAQPTQITTFYVQTLCMMQLVINPVAKVLYVGGANDAHCGLDVVDLDPSRATFHTVMKSLWIDGDGGTFGVNSRTGLLYVLKWNSLVPDGGLAHVLVVDGDPTSATFHTVVTDIVVDETTVGQHGLDTGGTMPALEVDPLTNRVYAHLTDYQQSGLDSLAVIDGASNTVESISILPFSQLWMAGGDLAVNPATHRIYAAKHFQILSFDGTLTETMSTPANAGPVTVTSNQVAVSFSAVATGGVTEIDPLAMSELNTAMPGGFALDGAQAYEVTTTASVAAPITLCFNASHVSDPAVFSALRVLHGENGALVDRTSSHDFATRTICATVNSLSPFVIARALERTYRIVPLYDTSKPANPGSTIPVRIQITDATGANLSARSLAVRLVELRQTAPVDAVAALRKGSPNDDFRFSAELGGSGGYIFNLHTGGLAPGAYELRFTVGSESRRYSVPVRIR